MRQHYWREYTLEKLHEAADGRWRIKAQLVRTCTLGKMIAQTQLWPVVLGSLQMKQPFFFLTGRLQQPYELEDKCRHR